ncbi:hypothetical protein Y032_0479g2222 [Ancylostoma ceylanicum]|uniref:Solute carrier family 40 member n=1 Tax=Ancylostoma ceylanicum TaxID=53326 RepID=A0A016WVZ6_9BILA|nr:hypothetical protein Y032_0479g2222 [Ancylostoma ceylanicum]
MKFKLTILPHIKLLVTTCGLQVTCAIFGGFSVVSMISKAFFLRALYMRKPKLAIKEIANKEKTTGEKPTSALGKVAKAFESIPEVLLTYTRQSVVAAAFGMALLFMTVMGFDGLAVGYGQSSGLSDVVLGAFRSYGSAMGILGALSYAFFERRLGVRTTGLLGLTCQQMCLIAAVTSIWLPGSPFDPKGYFHGMQNWWSRGASLSSNLDTTTPSHGAQNLDSIITFLVGIATARFGLWMADLSIVHIMQEGVPESDRNTVFGVHNALCQTFSLLKDILVIILPDPSTFGICILISYAFVTSGYLSFVYYLLRVGLSMILQLYSISKLS